MPYLITCTYAPGASTARLAVRDVHLSYIIENLPRIEYAGALTTADGKDAVGMFIALKTDSEEEARRFIEHEPYATAGFFSAISVARLRRFIPQDEPQFLVQELERERARLAVQT